MLRIAVRVASRNNWDLVGWQRAMDLAESVYRVTDAMPAEERVGVRSQMRRAAAAIPANIAEGQGRRTCGEFLNQLSVAHGSVRELETHVMLAGRLGHIPERSVNVVLNGASEVGTLLTGLIKSLSR